VEQDMEDIGIGAGLGAIGLWIFVSACVVGGIWAGIRKREGDHETLRRMVESGQPIDQALVNKLLGGDKRLDIDLRVSGLIVLFVAPGLALMGWFLSMLEQAALFPLLGASLLVGCVGIGLLVAAKSAERAYQKEEVSPRNRPAP
jgi:hypothetical protein